MAMMSSLGSSGAVSVELSDGVPGKEGSCDDGGVGRDGLLVGTAIGRVRESLLVVREAVDEAREERVSDISSMDALGGGGGISPDIDALLFSASRTELSARDARGGACFWTPPSMLVVFMSRTSGRSVVLRLGGVGERRRGGCLDAILARANECETC